MEWKPEEIKTLRQALGLTQAEFAKKFSLSRSLVAYWEKGKKSPTEDGNKILEQLKKEMPTDLEHRFLNTPCGREHALSAFSRGVSLANLPLKIKALREALGLTQAALAKKLKISERLVRYWETGKRSPSPFFQAKLKQLTKEQEQNVTDDEQEQNVTDDEQEQNVTDDEQEQIITSEGGGQNVTSSEAAENIAQVSCKEAALEYLSYGWSVIPLCPPDCSPDKVPWHWRDKDGKPCKCAHPGKVPLIAWTVYQERLPTALEVEQWFSKWPFANVGIVTGRVSKLLVVDFDDTIAIDAILEFGVFPKTPEVKTGGSGRHNYFQHPLEGNIANFAGKLKSVHPDLSKVDFRADGGQVVAPPSLHVAGNRYVWTVPPNEVSPPDLPKWFFSMLEQKPTARKEGIPKIPSESLRDKQTNKDTTFHSAGVAVSNFPKAAPVVVNFASRLPDNFSVLKKCDSLIKSLWSNESLQVSKKGGPETSDYDWALGRACIERGIRNRDDLATILAHFPHGKYARDSSETNLALTVEKLMQTVPHLSYEDAENVLANMSSQLNTHIKELKERDVLVLRATPGLGKTTEIIEVIKNSERKVILAEPTKDMARTVFEQFSDDTALLKGRDSTCCMRYSQVQAIAAKGYMPGKVICPGCPYSPEKLFTNCCEYFRQFFSITRVKVTTYEQALELHFAGKLDADLLVLDEDPSRALFQKVEITANQLHFPSSAKYPLPTFGRLIRDTLHEAEEKAAGQTLALRCRDIVELLLSVAKKRRIKLTKHLRLVSSCIENVFDQPARLESLTSEEIEALPHAYVGFLAKEMLSEIEFAQKASGDIWNSRLTLVVSGGRARFLLRDVRLIPVRTPIVVLDAYANKDYYSKLLGRDVRLLMFDAQSHCEVMTIPLNTSKNAFLKRKENLVDDLAAVVYRYPNRKILVYTYLFLKEDVEKMFLPRSGISANAESARRDPQSGTFVSVEHFWSGRGKDCWRDYDVVIIFGTPEPNPNELFDDARALYADDSSPISLAQSESDPRKYADSRLQLLREMRREDEIMQDVHRIRPIWGKGLSKKVVLMSQLYCPQLPPDKIIDPQTLDKKYFLRELRKERLIKLVEACIKEYGFYFDSFAVAAGLIKTTGGGVCMQGFDGVSECMDTGFRELGDGVCEKRGGVGERMDTGYVQPSNKNILIRELYITSNDAGSASYGEQNYVYRNDRYAILAELGLSPARMSVHQDGVWRPYKIWGNLDAAKAFFAEVEKQKSEEEKARREYEEEVRRELDEEFG